MNPEIDFILTYLNPNDIEWQLEKNRYTPGEDADVNPNRYREWDNLHFFFRGIEKNAPWVRKVHIVTCGHLPNWLNTDHPKINIVKHSDYIPEEWLPTFSSRCIDMNFQRIPDLAEHFVYFNDDMFLTKKVTQSDFFVNGLPCDTAILKPPQYRLIDKIALHLAPVVDTAVINKHFNLNETIKGAPRNWITLKYGKALFRSMFLMTYHKFCGFSAIHLPYSYLKSTYREVWEKEEHICTLACKHRFRETTDVNHWLFTYWQLASNTFRARSVRAGQCFQIHHLKDAIKASKAISKQQYKMVCINDTLENNQEFDEIRDIINHSLNTLFEEKSTFER